jgi:hypothetical protein
MARSGLMLKLTVINLKIKRDLIKIVFFRFIYTDLISFWKITEGIRDFINHGSLLTKLRDYMYIDVYWTPIIIPEIS